MGVVQNTSNLCDKQTELRGVREPLTFEVYAFVQLLGLVFYLEPQNLGDTEPISLSERTL